MIGALTLIAIRGQSALSGVQAEISQRQLALSERERAERVLDRLRVEVITAKMHCQRVALAMDQAMESTDPRTSEQSLLAVRAFIDDEKFVWAGIELAGDFARFVDDALSANRDGSRLGSLSERQDGSNHGHAVSQGSNRKYPP